MRGRSSRAFPAPRSKAWLAVAVVSSLAGAWAAAEVNVPRPKIVRGESCVEPTEIMRREHMKVLLHQRDETVTRGVRTRRHSLVGCVDCHADRDARGEYLRVDAEGQFCQACHVYVAVEMDCFQCHSATPSLTLRSSALPDAEALLPSPLGTGAALSVRHE